MPDRPAGDAWLAVEAAAAGLAFGALLEWVSTALVGSFRPQYLADPYWRGVPWLRTDTSGFAAFIIAAACVLASEYLRLRRRRLAASRGTAGTSPPRAAPGDGVLLAFAASETVVILATGLFSYLSVNAVTHHFTLQLQATHLLSWPTEGTLRVVALLLCVCSFGLLRYLRPRIAAGREPPPSSSSLPGQSR
jgi:uncharacterized membrane protein